MYKLADSTIKAVCSGQVITSPYSIVKELVENSVDAGANILDIRLEEYGLSKIEIRDNGSGIPDNQRRLVVLPHYTSKLQSFGDISGISTYGYRGEALSAICTVAIITMTTKHSSDSIATSYKFDPEGHMTSTGTSHLNQGTTFVVTELFKSLPVRKNYYKGKKGKEQLDTVEHFLKGMCIANSNVRYMLRHNKKLIWQHSSTPFLKNSLSSIYGTVGEMIYIYQQDGESKIEGMLTPTTKSVREPPFYIINKRIVKFKALSKLIKKLYEKGYPNGAILITVSPADIDVNVEVDKSAVICKNEKLLLAMIESQISEKVLILGQKAAEEVIISQDFYEANIMSHTQDSVNTTHDLSMLGDSNQGCINVNTRIQGRGECTKLSGDIVNSDTLSCADNYIPRQAENPSLHNTNAEEITVDISLFTSKEHKDELIERGPSLPVKYSTPTKENISIWDALEEDLGSESEGLNTDLGSDNELFSPNATMSPLSSNNFIGKQKLENVDDLPSTTRDKKQTSIISWSQGNTDFKLDFISPSPRNSKTPAKRSSISNCNNKRSANISPLNHPEKKRKTLTSPLIKETNNSLKFSMSCVKSTLSRVNNTLLDASALPFQAFEIENKWLIVWKDKIFAFNPIRAQEINIYNKLMSSHSLKYGHNLNPPYEIKITDISSAVLNYLIKSPVVHDDMDNMTYIKDSALAVNGIRIRKKNDGCFLVTNVCDVIEDFCKDDVINTLHLIEQYHSTSDKEDNLELIICDYAQIRCPKICKCFREKATTMSNSLAVFKPTTVDVIDLFSNTVSNSNCVHNNLAKQPIWDMNLNIPVSQD